ncbi:MAG: hypothetical protein IPL33_12320 [Sphingobacteriales bacterium]|nr:hypothetical protein [Sphingobacteriales bacterium]
MLRAATFGRGIWETPLPTIGTSGCTCSICGDEDYPLQAHFTAAPDGITSTINPNFEVEANWLQWMTVLFPIKLVDASTGLMPADGYEWAFTGNTSLPLNCDGDFLSNDPCASVAWLEAGTHTATLTVTDTEGCTSSFRVLSTSLPTNLIATWVLRSKYRYNTLHKPATSPLQLAPKQMPMAVYP